eukprot:m.150719 g.150719  ORF g.150719 m.150719 type:complete len:262 (+) comp30741_c0_seq4:1795-2580(+)
MMMAETPNPIFTPPVETEMDDMLDVPISLKYDTREYLSKPSLVIPSRATQPLVRMSMKRREEVNSSLVVCFIKANMTPMGMASPGLASISIEGYEKLVSESSLWQNAASKELEMEGKRVHLVGLSDTIQGVALKYGTTTQMIKQLNQLGMNGNIFERQWLYLPTGNGASGPPSVALPTLEEFQEQSRIAIKATFMQHTMCSDEESKCYVELNDFDFSKAIHEYQEDLKWQNTAAANGKLKSLSDYMAKLEASKKTQKVISI